MQVINGTRVGSLLQTILYLTGVPVFLDEQDGQSSVRTDGRAGGSLHINNLVSSPHPDDPLNTQCFGVLGCLRVKYAAQRGFHLFPEPLQIIKPTICLQLYNDRSCQIIEPETVKLMLVGPGKSSYWITHGYIDTGNRPWIQKLVSELLEYDNDCNVFVVDWGRGAEPPYTQAVMNVELLGAYVGHVMMLIEEAHGLRINETHFIGHSLGAHFGGFVGSWLGSRGHQLGRITGLDPAQPYFQLFNGDVRLDPSDADFVDIIHTDAKPLLHGGSLTGLGTQEPSGHADFYPNSGKDQPGCSDGVYQAILQEQGSFIYGLRRFFGCDHIRSYEIFTESIKSPCSYMGFACPTWESFLSSTCSPKCDGKVGSCNRMGFHAKKPTDTSRTQTEQFWSNGANDTIPVPTSSVLYYSMTGNRFPYCREHYAVTLRLAGKAAFRTNSDFNMLVMGQKGVVDKMRLGARDLRGGLSFKYTVAGHRLSSPVQKIVLKPTVSNPIWWLVNRVVRNPDITVDYVTLTNLETLDETMLCPEGKSYLRMSEENSNVVLTAGSCAAPAQKKSSMPPTAIPATTSVQ